MEYTWKITEIKVKNEETHQNAVVQTYWQKIGTDAEGNIGIFEGATPFTSVDVPENEFVPVDQLTESIVLNWIQSKIDDTYENHIHEMILKSIEDSKNPEQTIDLPWN